MRTVVSALAVAAVSWVSISGGPAADPLETADLAWDRGDYVSALTGYIQALDSADEAAFERIALQTGELFETVELTADGDAPRFSPDGRLLTYETGALPRRTIRLAQTANPQKTIAELPGIRAAFSPDGSRLAYLRITVTPALEAAAAAVEVGPLAQRNQRLNAFNAQVGLEAAVVIRDLSSGQETTLDTGALRKTGLAFAANDVLVAATPGDGAPAQIYALRAGSAPTALTAGAGDKVLGEANRAGTAVAFTTRAAGGRGGAASDDATQPAAAGTEAEPVATAQGQRGGRGAPQRFGVITFPDRRVTNLTGTAPAFSPDNASLAWIHREGPQTRLLLAPLSDPGSPATVRAGSERMDAPTFSADGGRIAYQLMPREDWEIHAIGRDGKGEHRITREIQHDILPRFIGADRIIASMGEPRHRRSYLYDLAKGTRTRIFHNNTVRTIAPEYAWVPSPDGARLLLVAERDGDTVSVERGVYLVDLTRRIGRDALRARLRANLASEQALKSSTQRMFAPIAADVRRVLADASIPRVFAYQKALHDFDSKHVSQPGNRKAAQYLFDTYKSFGYAPQFQAFDFRSRNLSGRTANVLATLRGTTHPELVYVVSSHFDSVATGPGADDDSSGTAALLETARLLARTPLPATVIFASFTGEEAGLLGSREFVRQAVADKVRIVGALNNDMIGWANDHRLDNTIRYSNAGIRDIQHGAAMHFTSLITYDALYYKGTDAAAYYEAFGDIVGGIGSYPVLGSPHYHQSHDVLETINHQLVTEVAKTTAATLVYLASSPSRLAGLEVQSYANGTARLSWSPSPEQGITGYIVAYGPPDNPMAQQMRVTQPMASITKVSPGTVVAVKAVNARGLEGWDWARVTVR